MAQQSHASPARFALPPIRQKPNYRTLSNNPSATPNFIETLAPYYL